MIHDIEPRIFNNNFINKKAESKDLFLSYDGDTVLVREDKDKLLHEVFMLRNNVYDGLLLQQESYKPKTAL